MAKRDFASLNDVEGCSLVGNTTGDFSTFRLTLCALVHHRSGDPSGEGVALDGTRVYFRHLPHAPPPPLDKWVTITSFKAIPPDDTMTTAVAGIALLEQSVIIPNDDIRAEPRVKCRLTSVADLHTSMVNVAVRLAERTAPKRFQCVDANGDEIRVCDLPVPVEWDRHEIVVLVNILVARK